jgi:hypothetical protein
MSENNKKQQNKITSYNIFIKDSFNIIYNRPSLGLLPKYIKTNIINLKNKKLCLIIVELAKIWKNFNNQDIILKYKNLISGYKYFTNNMYENIIINRINILNKFYLCLNFNLSIIYLFCFYKFLEICLNNSKTIRSIYPTPTLKYL